MSVRQVPIIEYLDETKPGMKLLPDDPAKRYKARPLPLRLARARVDLGVLIALFPASFSPRLPSARSASWPRSSPLASSLCRCV